MSVGHQVAKVGGCHCGGDRHADGAADLLGTVEQPGSDPGIALGDAGQGTDRDRDKSEGGTGTGDQKRPGQVGQKWPFVGTWVAHRIPTPMNIIPSP